MRERGGRRGVGQIVCRDIDCLHRRDRAVLRGRDTLLQCAHFGCQRGLVADGGRHTAKQRRNLGASLRETEDVVEKIGVGKAKQMAEDADLILYVVDSSLPLDDNDREIMELLSGRKSIVIYNKTDLEAAVDIEELKEKTGSPVIPVSVVEETGISQLEDEIKRMFFHGELSFNDEVYITNARHKAALEEADRSLDLVRNSIERGMPEDFFSIDLMNAYENLGKILGESVGEDLVNEIFSKFCMGK